MDHGVIVMVIAIVAIVFGTRIWKTYLLTHAKRGRSHEDEQLFGTMQAQIERLSDRVAVLEKLATDGDRNLAKDIERLRDRPGANF